MDQWREELAVMGAHLSVMHMALRALLHAHPDPAAVLAEWSRLRADSVAAAYALPRGVHGSDWFTAQVQGFSEQWTAELADAVSRRRAA